jgi:uncharacterized protein
MPLRVTLILCFVRSVAFSQEADPIAEIAAFQTELNQQYKTPDKSPLDAKALKKFKKHSFYDVDLKYRVVATLDRNVSQATIQMKTSTTRLAKYKKYAVAKFQIDGKEYALTVYQSLDLMKSTEYKDHLFLPFIDQTSGDETYGAGRYIDLRLTDANEIIIDFNKAYNPYCAYSDSYSCPKVPEENYLDVAIRAGIRYQAKH